MKTVILTILVFGVIIMLHESGHFLFAKLFHVKVEEFSFGMGPKLWSRIKRGTQYTIRASPVGGYVAMEGEDDAGSGAVVREKIVSAAEGGPLYEKPAWQRFIIMAAGAVMNVIRGALRWHYRDAHGLQIPWRTGEFQQYHHLCMALDLLPR